MLEQTKGNFKLAGVVSGLEDDRAITQGIIKNGANAGKQWRSLKFRVNTSATNQIPVELFASEQEFAYFYNFTKKETQKVPFEQRHNKYKGSSIIGTTISLARDEKGNLVRENFAEYDGVEEIFEKLNNGDSVYITGELQHSEYTSEMSGETIQQTRYSIRSISLNRRPINFDEDNFVEVASFEQELVVTDVLDDSDTGKVYLNANIINYGDRIVPAQFVINPALDAGQRKLARSILKRCKYGDFMKVYGQCVNALETVEVEAEIDDDWGGSLPAGYNVGTNVVRELLVTGIDSASYEPQKYTEEDFSKNSFDVGTKNPFDDPEFDEDDLPF